MDCGRPATGDSQLRKWLLLLIPAVAGSSWPVAHADTDASAFAIHGQIDLRAVAVDSPVDSFAHGGTGALRFDASHEGVQVGRLLLDMTGALSETLRLQLVASGTDDQDENPLDITEAFAEWRPYPQSQWRWRTRVGAFYPAISLENRTAGWQSLYSLSPSAINTWIGEEIRTIGVEMTVTSAGAPLGRAFDMSFTAAVYGWNDPMGVLLFRRGWGIHDRQTPLFGSLPRTLPTASNQKLEFFEEIDDRAGYYVGAEIKWFDRYALRAMHYDNRGDPGASQHGVFGWLSRFDAVGARVEWEDHWTFIAQGMRGDTGVGPSVDRRGRLAVDYWSWFALGSVANGSHRFTLRYDRMVVDSTRGAQFFNSNQDADAWTAAWLYDVTQRWQVGVEAIRFDNELTQRARVRLEPGSVEQEVQVAVRYSF
jgi:hypothetical protein